MPCVKCTWLHYDGDCIEILCYGTMQQLFAIQIFRPFTVIFVVIYDLYIMYIFMTLLRSDTPPFCPSVVTLSYKIIREELNGI